MHRAYDFPSHKLLALFMVPDPYGANLKRRREGLVIPTATIPLLHQWARLARRLVLQPVSLEHPRPKTGRAVLAERYPTPAVPNTNSHLTDYVIWKKHSTFMSGSSIRTP